MYEKDTYVRQVCRTRPRPDGTNCMNIKERWVNFILPYINRMMEWVRNDPDCSYDEWRQIKQNYKDSVGKDYERTN